VWQDDTWRVPKKVHSIEIATFKSIVKAKTLSVIAYDDAGIFQDSNSDINHLITPKTVNNGYIKTRGGLKTQDSIDCFNTR